MVVKHSKKKLHLLQPFYGGKLHRISGEVKNPDGSVSTKIAGTWNGEIEITGPVS